jgi:hypothetical protein
MTSVEEKALVAEHILSTIVSGVVCVAQDWDNRIDCLLSLPDGTVVGEMVPIAEFSEERIAATGLRLKKRSQGTAVELVNELKMPVRLRDDKELNGTASKR